MRKTLLSALAVAILLGTSGVRPAQAQDSAEAGLKPVLTVSVSGFEALMKDLRLIAEASGNAGMADMLQAMVEQQASEALKAIDRGKPFGAVVQTNGQEFQWYAFAPVTDLEQLLGQLRPLAPEGTIPEPAADGVYEIEAEGQQFVLAGREGWALLADSRETLGAAPADPAKALGGLHESYAVALRVNVNNIPQEMRNMALFPLQMGIAMGQQRMPDESDEAYAVRKQMTERSMEEFVRMINETATFQMGLGVDSQSKAVRLDIDMTAVEGTSVAADYALLGESKSDLGGFFRPEAVVTGLWAGKMGESDVAQVRDMIDTYGTRALDDLDQQGLSGANKQMAKRMLGDLLDVARKTIDSRRVDAGFALLAESDSLNLVFGSFLADAPKLEKLVKEMLGLVAQDVPEVAKLLTLDAEEHQGVRFHTVSISPDELPEELEKLGELPPMMVGEKLTAVLAFGDQNIYLAAGPRAVETLKQALDQSKSAAGQTVSPFHLSVSAAAIARLVVGVADEEDLRPAAPLLQAMKQAGPNDHVRIVVEAIPDGMRTRFEVEEGVLKLIGMAVMVAQEAMLKIIPPPPPPTPF